jgi:hypothetical protein
MRVFHLLPLLFFSTISGVWAQQESVFSKNLSLAKTYFQDRNYFKALPLFEYCDSASPNNTQVIYPLGICYMNTTFQEKKALTYFSKCLQNQDQYPITLHYYIGKAYHLSDSFDVAIRFYETYLNVLPAKKKNQSTIALVKREIERCKDGIVLMHKPIEIEITNLGPEVNSAYDDYGPVLSADEYELLFTSSRPGTTGGKTDPNDGHYYEDIYRSFRLGKIWTPAENLGAPVNTGGHDASISLSPDGQSMIFYRYDDASLTQSGTGNLYQSKLNGERWDNPEVLSNRINSNEWEPSACIFNDGKTMVFSSNRPGGFGGLDLYFSKLLPTGEWALAVNAGPTINSAFDEDAPFMHPDGHTLYFSSNGHNAIGGFDLFYCELEENTNKWLAPKNFGYPLNTGHDELHFGLSPDGNRIYFAGVRPEGFGGKDIYVGKMKQEPRILLISKGLLLDSLGKPLNKTAEITITNQNSGKLIGLYHTNAVTSKYILILPENTDAQIIIKVEEKIVFQENWTTKGLTEYKEDVKNLSLK